MEPSGPAPFRRGGRSRIATASTTNRSSSRADSHFLKDGYFARSESGRWKNSTTWARRFSKSARASSSPCIACSASLVGTMSHFRPRISPLRLLTAERATEYMSATARSVANVASLMPSDPGVPTGRFQPTGYCMRRVSGRPSSRSTSIGMGCTGDSGPNPP